MDHLTDFGVCALAGSTTFIILHNYFKKIFKCFYGCSNLMLHSKSPIIRRKAKREVQYCQTVKWAMRIRNCIKIGKMSSFQMNPHSKPISFAPPPPPSGV